MKEKDKNSTEDLQVEEEATNKAMEKDSPVGYIDENSSILHPSLQVSQIIRPVAYL